MHCQSINSSLNTRQLLLLGYDKDMPMVKNRMYESTYGSHHSGPQSVLPMSDILLPINIQTKPVCGSVSVAEPTAHGIICTCIGSVSNYDTAGLFFRSEASILGTDKRGH